MLFRGLKFGTKSKNSKKKAKSPPSVTSLVPEASSSEISMINFALQNSMTSIERLWGLLNAVKHLEAQGIPGDFVECGVWKGGSSRLMADALLQTGNTSRTIWLYDTFDGMTEPTVHDKDANGVFAEQLLHRDLDRREDSVIWAVARIEGVRNLMLDSGYPERKLNLVKGDVLETLRSTVPKSIALLRLDTDWYESTKFELEVLMPKMTPGGVVIVDDYGHWSGSKRAVDEYFEEAGARPLLHRLDYTGRLFVVG